LPTPKVVIDTSIWVDFFRGTVNPRADAVEKLVRSGHAVTCGIVQAELLAGIRDESERERLRQGMTGIEYVETTRGRTPQPGSHPTAERPDSGSDCRRERLPDSLRRPPFHPDTGRQPLQDRVTDGQQASTAVRAVRRQRLPRLTPGARPAVS